MLTTTLTFDYSGFYHLRPSMIEQNDSTFILICWMSRPFLKFAFRLGGYYRRLKVKAVMISDYLG